MLIAYGPDSRPIVAEEAVLEQLQHWSRDHQLYCPNCRGIVHVRGGAEKRTQLHFAHQKGECAWSTEGESVRHAQGKLALAHWLRQQFPQSTITLEERLPAPNRIADVFVVHTDGRRWAIEFQCAPLDIEEWKKRHEAYRHANILDLWIIGNNRRDKQEAFIEAVIASAQEVLFLDPQVSPPRIWLRWPIARSIALEWQGEQVPHRRRATLDGWVGRLGYGATLIGPLSEVRCNEQGQLLHPVRTALNARTNLFQSMTVASAPDAEMLATYLQQRVSAETLRIVLTPLLRAYLLDPDLLLRYNYGRGQPDQTLSEADRQRVQRACAWIKGLAQQGFTDTRLQGLIKEIPFTGPYAAFAGYLEMLIALSR